ncbi:hypothetical protein JVU11DRAFT_7167 [Chiua virens]|nr:hypothetical protein JVU11DRAFT_7167 [Chiua virens]
MVHWWQDPEVEAQLRALYVDMVFLLLGIHGWDYLHNSGVEYSVIRRRLSFRWPLIPYLVGRLCLLIQLLLLAIETSGLSDHFACQLGTSFIAITGGTAVACASTNFMIRTWVIWKNSRLVHILIFLVALGHCTLLIIDWANIKATKSQGACVIYIQNPQVSAGVYVYTVSYDFLALLLAVVKLSNQSSKSHFEERLRTQHLSYFVVAAVANVLPMVFCFLDSNGMVEITGSLAMTARYSELD